MEYRGFDIISKNAYEYIAYKNNEQITWADSLDGLQSILDEMIDDDIIDEPDLNTIAGAKQAYAPKLKPKVITDPNSKSWAIGYSNIDGGKYAFISKNKSLTTDENDAKLFSKDVAETRANRNKQLGNYNWKAIQLKK